MAKIEKLKSGNYRIRLEVGKDSNGVRRRKSFTSSVRKELVELEKKYKTRTAAPVQMTISECLDGYLASRDGVVSPGTVRGYVSLIKMLKQRCPSFCSALADDLDRKQYQRLVNQLQSFGCSPKTMRNYTGFVGAALKFYDYAVPNVRLPQRVKPDYHIPDPADVRLLAAAAAGTDMEIILAMAVLGLRRSEICALVADDLDGNVLHIRRAAVYDQRGVLITKISKTYASDRFIQIPDVIARMIREQGFVTKLSPRQVSRRFVKLLRETGVAPFRFHDLRHFFVSYCHTVLRLSDAQIQALGGWSSPYVMTNYYRQTLNEKQAALLVANQVANLLE